MEIPFAQMRGDFDALVGDWGASVTITRNAGSTTSQGRRASDWQTVGTETMWIQSLSVTDKEMVEQGIVEGTTHVAFQRYSGTELRELDRITVSGDANPYDVVGTQLFPNHRRSWLKQVKKS